MSFSTTRKANTQPQRCSNALLQDQWCRIYESRLGSREQWTPIDLQKCGACSWYWSVPRSRLRNSDGWRDAFFTTFCNKVGHGTAVGRPFQGFRVPTKCSKGQDASLLLEWITNEVHVAENSLKSHRKNIRQSHVCLKKRPQGCTTHKSLNRQSTKPLPILFSVLIPVPQVPLALLRLLVLLSCWAAAIINIQLSRYPDIRYQISGSEKYLKCKKLISHKTPNNVSTKS